LSIEDWNQLEQSLKTLPGTVEDAYVESKNLMQEVFSDDELLLWGKEGLSIGTQTVRSWEAAIEYFNVSHLVVKSLAFPSFMQWARCGTHLSQDAPSLASSFFNVSPTIVTNLRPQYIPRWVGLGRSLYKGTWKSGNLASKFFEMSPELVRNLPFWDLEIFASILETISSKSYEVASDCLDLGATVLPAMSREREVFLSMLRSLTDTSWREVKSCLEVVPRAAKEIDESQIGRFLKLGEKLAKTGMKDTSRFLSDGTQALSGLESNSHGHIIDLCETLLGEDPDAVQPFLKSLEPALNLVTLAQLDQWFSKGVDLIKENKETGLAYFKIESNTSETVLNTLSSSVDLDLIKGIINMYCTALSGQELQISNSQELVDKGIGWIDGSWASTDGTQVFLPSIVDQYDDKAANFSWFKVIATHQVARLEFGSFEFEFEKPSAVFSNRRKETEQAKSDRLQKLGQPDDAGNIRTYTDIGKLFNLFEESKLAFDIFTVLEDCRLDHIIKTMYPGIKTATKQIQDDAILKRPELTELPLKEAMVELLIRFSLDQFNNLQVPTEYEEVVNTLANLVNTLRNADSTVEDSAEATIRAYEIISKIINDTKPEEEWKDEDLEDQLEQFDEDEFESLVEKLQQAMEMSGEDGDGDGDPYDSPSPVEYRGDFKPEMVQLMSKLQSDAADGGDDQPLSQEELEQLLQESNDLELDAEQGELDAGMFAAFVENIMKEAGMPPPDGDPGDGQSPVLSAGEEEGELEAQEPKTFAYDEWDFRADDYKPRWCIVKEKVIEEGEQSFYTEAIANYSGILAHIKRQFELIMPETWRKTYRLVDGEDIDLNAAIEAVADLRMGIPPDDKIYWRRNKVERDVAAVFLLDMSASTAEAIDEGKQTTDDSDAPDDPVEYMVWLRRRREGLTRRNYKRIIDLEKESAALITQAIESIGDQYGIYGFSGYGRENVEFYVIKDIDEPFNDTIKRRIDKITPLHATRMGASIRHAITKLEHRDATTKIMFLISDGRPQDRGYSREGVEKEYAVHDTHQALIEARRKNIIPFCLTVDKAGHDYLKDMCGDMGYEVLDNIWSLPERLPMLYRNLTK
jgi:nitric oxide reductase NorD protein